MECGKRFESVEAAERATYSGCPVCGGSDIDLELVDQSKFAKNVHKSI